MHIVVAALGILSLAGIWIYRMHTTADTASEVLGMARDVRLAARRFGFRRCGNIHPIDAIEDEATAVATLTYCFLHLDGLPTREAEAAALLALQSYQKLDATAAEEILTLGRWLANQGGGPAQAVARTARRLRKLSGPAALDPLLKIFKEVVARSSGDLSTRQTAALHDIKQAFRLN